MNTDLETYKQNKINQLKNTYTANISRLNYVLKNAIWSVQVSRLNRIQKQHQINNLINEYNKNVVSLKNALDTNIMTVQKYNPQPIVINKNKNALLIGINYTGTSNELYGCINDVTSIQERISNNGFKNINILTDNTATKPTKANILNAFKNLLVNSQAGDLLFVLYSGHGSYTIDKNNDELTGYDQMIIPSDFNPIVDDELKQIIQDNLKPNVTLFAMFDSCFSGSVLDLRYCYMDSLNYDKFTENTKELETRGNVFTISGCSDYQTSDDSVFNNKPNGAMTWSLLECLKDKPNCSWRQLVINMRDLLKKNGHNQIPQFSSGNFQNIDTTIFI